MRSSMYIAVKVTPDLFVKHNIINTSAFLVNICTCWLDANKLQDLEQMPPPFILKIVLTRRLNEAGI